MANSYSRTGYNAGGGDDAGGFVYGGSQGGSQSGGKGFNDESLRPVTIKQIIEAEQDYGDAPFRIDGVEVAQLTFVGMVRAISPQTTNITFRLDDGTGVIEVKQWLDAEKQDDGGGANGANGAASFALDQYIRVWGRLKSFNNKRHVGAFVIKPVADFNEVNYHLLEATYVHLVLTKGPPGGAAGAKGEDDSMFVDGGAYGGGADGGGGGGGGGAGGDKLRGVSARGKKLYNWLFNASGGNEGLNAHVIAQGAGMSMSDVMAASEELIAPGLVYTTVDDETFAILDS